jgi:hypothetical protein
MSRREHKLPLQFADYQRFGITEDFIKYLLNIGWTIHRNEIVASQLVITAFLYLQSRVAQLEGRTRKSVGQAMKIFLDYPQIVQKLVFDLSEKHEVAQEESQVCDVSTLLIRYLKNLVSFYLDYNSYYVVVGQTRYFLDYAPRHLEMLDRTVAPDLMRGGDKQLARAQKQIYGELARRFKDRLKQSNDGRRKYAFELLKNPERYVSLVKEALSRFNLWVSPPDIRRGRISNGAHMRMGQAEVDRYHTLLDFDSLMDLIGELSLPNPKNCWALPEFCMASNGPPNPDLDTPTWTDKELKAIEYTITATLARRQSATVKRLSILIDGEERYSFSPYDTRGISFALSRGEKLIEVISREPEGDLPLAAYVMAYDEDSYSKRWRFFGERRTKSTVTLEGGQKIGFTVSMTKNAEQEIIVAGMTVCFRPRSLLGRAAQWWKSFRSWNWRLSAFLTPVQALALCLIAALGLLGYRIYLQWQAPVAPAVVKQSPEPQEVVPTASPTPESAKSPPASHRMSQDNLDMVAVGKDGAVRLSDQTLLPTALSRSAREIIENGLVTPTENARLAMATIDDLTQDAQRRAQGSEGLLPAPASPIFTAIRALTPTLHWNSVPGAQEYQVRIAYPPDREDGKVVWEASVGTNTRAQAPSGVLQPGQVYLWQVEASVDGRSRVSPEAGFWVLDAESLRKVAAAERRYRRSALVRASVYEAYGLYEEALSQVERLAKMNPTSQRARTMLDKLRHELGRQ